MTDTNTTSDKPTIDAAALNTRFHLLQVRCQTVAEGLQTLIPVNGRSPEAQKQFLLAFADLKLLEHLVETAQSAVNGLNLASATPEELAAGDDLFAALGSLAQDLVDAIVNQLGVSPEVIIPTILEGLGRDLDLIETVVARAEKSLHAVTDEA